MWKLQRVGMKASPGLPDLVTWLGDRYPNTAVNPAILSVAIDR